MQNKLKRVPTLGEIFGGDADKKYSQIWREFARTMVEWGNFRNYPSAIAHFHIAFDTAKRLFGKSAALTVYQAVTEDVQLNPDEILQAAKYVHDSGDRSTVTDLAAKSYFLDLYFSEELEIRYHLPAYNLPDNRGKRDLDR